MLFLPFSSFSSPGCKKEKKGSIAAAVELFILLCFCFAFNWECMRLMLPVVLDSALLSVFASLSSTRVGARVGVFEPVIVALF